VALEPARALGSLDADGAARSVRGTIIVCTHCTRCTRSRSQALREKRALAHWHARMHACKQASTHAPTRTRTHARTHARTHKHSHTRTCTCAYVPAHAGPHACTHAGGILPARLCANAHARRYTASVSAGLFVVNSVPSRFLDGGAILDALGDGALGLPRLPKPVLRLLTLAGSGLMLATCACWGFGLIRQTRSGS
jgi:hypothetical protein